MKNRAISVSLAQGAFLGEEFPSDPSGRPPVFPQDQCEQWDLKSLPQGQASAHPVQPGLFVVPGALTPDECAAISSAVAKLTGEHGIQGEEGVAVHPPAAQPVDLAVAPDSKSVWEWFAYGHARWMVPLQPNRGVCDHFAVGPLSSLRSHNCTDARAWPRMSAIDGTGGEILRKLEALPSLLMPEAFGGRPPLFLQVQSLERGAAIGGHVDEHDVGGRAIATAVVSGGGGEVRVGGVAFHLREGDLYAIHGAARDDVDHEVYSSAGRANRISITTRYGGWVDADPYPFPREQSAMRAGSASRHSVP